MNTSNNSFLPEDYTVPATSANYMKIAKGDNRIRILSHPIIGWLDWNDKKPLRFKMSDKPEKPVDPSKPIRHFWAFIVWNYQTESVQILEITQSSIQKAIGDLSRSEEWGAPFAYDLKIVRKGEDKNTEYSVIPAPHKKLADFVIDAFNDKPCDLNYLFAGADPFDNPKNPTRLGEIEM